MKLLSLLLFILAFFPSMAAQEIYQISKPELSFSNNILTIKYDILGCGNNETVNIRLIALSSKGDTIKPKYVSGDIGKNVKCGFGKTITWNLEKEDIFLNDDISISIKGERNFYARTEIYAGKEKNLTRGKIMLLSAIMPGAGQSKASGKHCYYIFSGLVYGTLGTSIYYATKSAEYNKDYHAAIGSDRDILYDKWQDSYNKSRNFAIGCAGIWITNLVWSAVIPVKDERKMYVTFFSPKKNEFILSAKWNF